MNPQSEFMNLISASNFTSIDPTHQIKKQTRSILQNVLNSTAAKSQMNVVEFDQGETFMKPPSIKKVPTKPIE